MPIKTAFRRSLLNCQPIAPSSQKVVSTLSNKDDGYAGVPLGFSSIIERQVGLETNTTDAISLTGISDFEGAEKFSVDPERPEIISVSRPFDIDEKTFIDFLRLRNFECSIDEADLKTFYDTITSEESLKEVLNLRVQESINKKIEIKRMLDGLAIIADRIDDFRDEIDFIGSNKKIHQYASSLRKRFVSRFSDDPKGALMSMSRTLPNLQYAQLSNSVILQTILISLLTPGCVLFDKNNDYNVASSRFLLPTISHDPISDFLFSLSSKEVTNTNDFFEIESIIPKDNYSKLSLLAESLSYELSTTAGLKKARKDDLNSVLESEVNPLFDIIKDEVDKNKITGILRKENILPFEIRTHTIDGIRYGGILEGYVDPQVSSGDLNFDGLQQISSEVSSKIGNYISLTKKIRLLDSRNHKLTGAGIISFVCDYIARSVETLNSNVFTQSEPLQFSILCEISKNDTSSGVKARHDIFKRIFEEQESQATAVQVQENAVPMPAEKLRVGNTFRQNQAARVATASLQQGIVARQYISGQNSIEVAIPQNLSTIGSSLVKLASSSYDASVYSSQKLDNQQQGADINKFLNSKDSKVSVVGTTSATLSIFSVNSTDRVSDQVQYRRDIRNPIAQLATTSVSTTVTNLENKSEEILKHSIGSLPVSNRGGRKKNVGKLQFAISDTAGAKQTTLGGITIGNVFDVARTQLTKPKQSTKTSTQKTKNILSTFITATQLNSIVADAGRQDVLGTSFTVRGIQSHLSKIPSSNPFSQVQPTFEERDISQESTSFNDVGIIEKISSIKLLNQRGMQSENKRSMQSNLSAAAGSKRDASRSSVTTQYLGGNNENLDYFNCLLDGTGDSQSSFICDSNIDSLLRSFSVDVGIAKKIRDCYGDLMQTVDTESQSQNLVETSGTKNFMLDSKKIQFIVFEIFMSILSMTKSSRMVRMDVQGDEYVSDSFNVQSRMNLAALKDELDSLIKIAGGSGSVSSVISSGGISLNFSNLIKSMSYCMLSSDLVFERSAVLEAFYTTYSNSIASLTSLKSNQLPVDSISLVKKYNQTHLLSNLTEESISYRQILFDKYIQNPISSYNKLKLSKIASSTVSKFFKKMKEVNPTVISVGVPTRSLESLRRSSINQNISVNETKREYVEIELFKRDLQFSDIMYVPTKVRFCQTLEVIPLFATGNEPTTASEDFSYMCYIDGKWETRKIDDAVLFVANQTGLRYSESIVVVMNHIVDAICRLTNSVLFANPSDSFSFADDYLIVDERSYEFIKLILQNQKISSLFPLGDLSIDDLLVRTGNVFRLKKFSEIGIEMIDKIDEPTYRLLLSILRGSIFNYEMMPNESLKTLPFERYYSLILSENDYDIDKSLTYSTAAGKVVIDGILREGFAYQDGEFVRFINDETKISTLKSREFSARLNLVSN